MESNKTVDSHTSYLTNRKVVSWLMLIDFLGFTAANSCRYGDISAYYNAIEQTYLSGIITILPDEIVTSIETIRKNYRSVANLIETNENARTRKAMVVMLQLAKEFNFKLTTGLQEREYLFRMGSRTSKGLNKIKFLESSIFNAKSKEKGGEEDAD